MAPLKAFFLPLEMDLVPLGVARIILSLCPRTRQPALTLQSLTQQPLPKRGWLFLYSRYLSIGGPLFPFLNLIVYIIRYPVCVWLRGNSDIAK